MQPPIDVGQMKGSSSNNIATGSNCGLSETRPPILERPDLSAARERSAHTDVDRTDSIIGRFISRIHKRFRGAGAAARVQHSQPITAEPTTSKMELKWNPSPYQRELLQKTWCDDFDVLYELGSNIYEYIFDHEPAAKLLFPKVAEYGDKWKESVAFRGQALKFVQVISQAIKSMYNLERVDAFLAQVGARHVRLETRGFRREYWAVFRLAIEHSMRNTVDASPTLTADEKADAIETWKCLADYIVSKMSLGYDEALGSRRIE